MIKATLCAALLLTTPATAQVIGSDNGQTFTILGTRIIENPTRADGPPYATATVLDKDDDVISFTFDCDGSFMAGKSRNWYHTAAHSVIERIGKIACRGHQ